MKALSALSGEWRDECHQEAVFWVAEEGTAGGEEAWLALFCFVFMTKERAESSKENKTRLERDTWLSLPGWRRTQRRSAVAQPCWGTRGHRGLQRQDKGEDEGLGPKHFRGRLHRPPWSTQVAGRV